MALLTLGASGVWANVTVTLNDQTELDGISNTSQSEATATHKYGVYTGSDVANTPYYTTFTTNAESGIAGLVLSTTSKILKPTYVESTSSNYQHVMAIFTSDQTTYTFTINAPSGYYIKSYTLKAISTGSAGPYYITPDNGAATTVSSSLRTISTTPYSTSTTFTIQRTNTNTNKVLCIPQFSVILAELPAYSFKPVSINSTNGSLNNGDNWSNTWTASSTLTGMTLKSGGFSNMKQTTSAINLHSANKPTYTLTAPSGYRIAGYTIAISSGAENYITPSGKSQIQISTDVTAPTYVTVTDINATTTTFTRTFTSNGSDGNSTFVVYLEPVYPVTYIVVDGSATVSGGSTDQTLGSAPDIANTVGANANSSYNNPYCTYAYYSDATCETPIATITGACTVYAKVVSTSDVPVEFASAVDDRDAKWYTLKLRDYQFYVDGSSVALSSTDITSANAQWVFTGSVYNAYVYNKVAEKYIVMSNGAIALNDTPQPWILAPHQSGAGFYLYDASNYKFPFRNSNGNLAYSQGPFYETANAASFVATEVASDYSEDIVSNVQPYFTTGVGSYFGLKTDVASTYDARVSAAATSCSAEEYSALLAVVSNQSNFVYPPTGFYRIKNYSTGAYWGQTSSTPTISFSNTDAASVLYMTRSGEEGSYMYTIKLQGTKYVGNKDQSTGDYILSVVAPGKFSMNDFRTNTIFGYTYADGTAINIYSFGGDAYSWSIEDATSFTVSLHEATDNEGSHTYATLCVPFNISGLTGAESKEVKTYVPTKDGDYIVTGSGSTTADAGMPVLLIGESGATSATATVGSTYVASPVAPQSSHVMTGTFTNASIDCTAATGTNYVLGLDEDNSNRIGFYHVNNDSFTLGANRAYLNTSAGIEVKGFAINFGSDIADGVNTVKIIEANGKYFDLSGREVAKPVRGIYIKDGRKVVVK